MPYRSSLYNSYSNYGYGGNYNMYNMGGYPNYGMDDAENRYLKKVKDNCF